MSKACSGCWSAAKENRERIAVRRTLRVLALLPRSSSRWVRNAENHVRGQVVQWSIEGGLPPCCWTLNAGLAPARCAACGMVPEPQDVMVGRGH